MFTCVQVCIHMCACVCRSQRQILGTFLSYSPFLILILCVWVFYLHVSVCFVISVLTKVRDGVRSLAPRITDGCGCP